MDTFLAELNSKIVGVPTSTPVIATSFLCVVGLFVLVFGRRLLAKPERPEVSKHSSNPTKEKATSGLTFRVTEIPIEVEESALRQFCESLASGNEAEVTIIALSLSPSSSSYDAERYQIATITFGQTPVVLRPCLSPPHTVPLRLSNASRSSEICFDTCFLGLTPLNNPQNPSVDIVAITGLAGHAFGSWKARGGPKMWLRDFLAHDLSNDGYQTRILTYGYDSSLVGTTSDASIHEYARKLLEAVKEARVRPHELYRPIIFLAHSLGGLVLKHALIEASKGNAKDEAIFKACYAAFFFGVPNRGLHITHLLSMAKGRRLVEDLGESSQVLPMMNREFERFFAFDDAKIYSIYETKDTRAVEYNAEKGTYERTGPWIRMVTRDSATNSGASERIYQQLSIDEDHSNMVKFDNRANPDYITIRGKIRECVEEAPLAIMKRFPKHRNKTESEKDCLRSLVPSSNDPTPRLPTVKIHPGTCQWIIENKIFCDWRTKHENSSKLLWIQGQPGSGKTATMSFIRDYFLAKEPDAAVIYFFCNDKYIDHRSARDILMSLLHQLLSQNPGYFKHVMSDYEKFNQEKEKRWSPTCLWKVIKAIMTDPTSGPIYCIIDALDECRDVQDEHHYSRSDFLKSLHELFLSPYSHPSSGRVIISSRPIAPIIEALPQVEQIISLEKFNGEDISLYISDQVNTLAKKLNYPQALKEEVEETLNEKSDSMFLWVYLTLHELSRRYTVAQVRQLLKTVSKGLFAYYENILATISNEQAERAREILMWVAHAVNPIKLRDLAFLLAIDDSAKCIDDVTDAMSMDIAVEIRELCGPLVKIVNERVMLVHRTLVDFLTTDSAEIQKIDPSLAQYLYHEKYYVKAAEAETIIARRCITYLSFPDHDEIDGGVLTYPAIAWPFHACFISLEDKKTKDALCKFVYGDNFDWWRKIYWNAFYSYEQEDEDEEQSLQPLYIASHLHILPLVQLCIEQGADVNHENGTYFNALHCAAGHLGIVKLLVENGAKVNALGGWHGTPLMAAIYYGNMEVVEYLFSKGADVNIKGGHFGCPLQVASWSGRLEMVKLLVEKYGVDIQEKCGEFGCSLLSAAWSGHLDIVDYFLEKGMSPDSRGRWDGFPLQAAVRRKQWPVIERLFEKGASVNLQGGVFGSALHAAVNLREPKLVQMLISKGADVNIPNERRGSALHCAAEQGDIGIVKTLVENGADREARDSKGRTPEEVARKESREDIAEYLGARTKDDEGIDMDEEEEEEGAEGEEEEGERWMNVRKRNVRTW